MLHRTNMVTAGAVFVPLRASAQAVRIAAQRGVARLGGPLRAAPTDLARSLQETGRV